MSVGIFAERFEMALADGNERSRKEPKLRSNLVEKINSERTKSHHCRGRTILEGVQNPSARC